MVMPGRRKSSFYLVNSYQWARWLLYAVLQWQTVKELLWHNRFFGLPKVVCAPRAPNCGSSSQQGALVCTRRTSSCRVTLWLLRLSAGRQENCHSLLLRHSCTTWAAAPQKHSTPSTGRRYAEPTGGESHFVSRLGTGTTHRCPPLAVY